MSKLIIIIGMVLSGFGIFSSFSSFAFFFFGNYHAAFWALVSGILAAIDFHLLFLRWRETLNTWHSHATMKDIEILGISGFVFGLASSAWYIFLFCYKNLPILPVDTSYQIAAVAALFTAKWSLGLVFTTRHLAKELLENGSEDPSYYRSINYYRRIAQ